MKFRFSREVNCPQKIAFDYYCERDNDLEWWGGVLESERTSQIKHGVGETVHQRCRTSGIPYTYEIDIEVVEWEPPNHWREVSQTNPNPYDCCYVVEKIDENRSRVILEGEVWFRGVLGRLLYPFARLMLIRQSNRNFDALKRCLDALGAEHTAGVANPQPT